MITSALSLPPSALWWSGGCAMAVAALLLARWRGSQRGQWLTKPVASFCFVALAIDVGDVQQGYDRWILTGLILGAAGDQLLIRGHRGRWFLAGLSAFLLGHMAYIVAFLSVETSGSWRAGLSVVVLTAAVWRWIGSSVPDRMIAAVGAYLGVIGAMLLAALAARDTIGAGVVLAAVAFAASDVLVARERFIRPGIINQLISYPLYFGAQLILAASTLWVN